MELVSIWEVTFEGETSLNFRRGSCSGDLVPAACDRGREGRAGGCGDSRFTDFDFFFFLGGLLLAHNCFGYSCSGEEQHFCHLQSGSCSQASHGAAAYARDAFLPLGRSLSSSSPCFKVAGPVHPCVEVPNLLREQGLPGCSYLIGTYPKPAILSKPLDVFVHFHALYNLQVLTTQLDRCLNQGSERLQVTQPSSVGGRSGTQPRTSWLQSLAHAPQWDGPRSCVPSASSERAAATESLCVVCKGCVGRELNPQEHLVQASTPISISKTSHPNTFPACAMIILKWGGGVLNSYE